uniref:Uncharacterized protein n=1 Tax=Arundo donax TaxID=35708 RepID=A0A0A8Y3I9_ARUDO
MQLSRVFEIERRKHIRSNQSDCWCPGGGRLVAGKLPFQFAEFQVLRHQSRLLLFTSP